MTDAMSQVVELLQPDLPQLLLHLRLDESQEPCRRAHQQQGHVRKKNHQLEEMTCDPNRPNAHQQRGLVNEFSTKQRNDQILFLSNFKKEKCHGM